MLLHNPPMSALVTTCKRDFAADLLQVQQMAMDGSIYGSGLRGVKAEREEAANRPAGRSLRA
jgi:hypothetical protein